MSEIGDASEEKTSGRCTRRSTHRLKAEQKAAETEDTEMGDGRESDQASRSALQNLRGKLRGAESRARLESGFGRKKELQQSDVLKQELLN